MGRNRSLVEQAVVDATELKDAAVETAKKKLVEQLTPAIKNLVERKINGLRFEDTDRLRRGVDDNWPGESHTGFEEGKKLEGDDDMGKKDDLDMEMESMFPNINEMEDEGDLDDIGEGAACSPEDELGEAAGSDDEIEIDTESLKRAYESVMKVNSALSEAEVTKGFADTYPKTEWETEEKPPSDTGLADKGADNKGWEETEPPAKKDWTVKEAIEHGLRENKHLRQYVTYLEGNLRKARGMLEMMSKKVNEVNLFNRKVLHVNELLSKYGKSLTVEQKKIVIEKIDQAKTIREVKMVASALTSMFKSTSLTESKRRPKANAGKRMTSGAPDQKVLRESVDKSGRDEFARLQELAGILK